MTRPTPDAEHPDDADASPPTGMHRGLTSYGDTGFSLFLRKAFIKGAGYTDDALDRPGDRHRQHRQRLQPLPRQRAAADRSGQARRDAGGRPADGVSDDLDPRELRGTDQHVPAQPDVDRHRGDDPRAADGRGGADRRLRQDRAGAADGRGVGEHPGDPARHRLDADRLRTAASASAPAPTAAATGAASAPTRSTRRRSRDGQRPARRERGHLLGDGHGQHDGLHRRSARHDGARRRFAARASPPTASASPSRPARTRCRWRATG